MATDISFDDLVPTKQTSTPVAKGDDLSFDDLIPKQPVVGSRIHNIARTGVESLPAAGAGLYGFGTGMAAAAPVATAVAPLTGPFAPLTAGAIELAGGLGGAFIASGAAQKVTDMLHELVAPDDFKQRQIEKAQRPYGTFAAQTLANLAGMSPKTAPEVAGKLLTKPVAQRVASAGLQTGIEAGTQLATEGKVDPVKLGMSAIAGAAMPGFNVAGKKVFGAGESVGKAVTDKMFKTKPAITTTTDKETTASPTPDELLLNVPKSIGKEDLHDLSNWVSQATRKEGSFDPVWLAGQKKNFDKALQTKFLLENLKVRFLNHLQKKSLRRLGLSRRFLKMLLLKKQLLMLKYL